MLGAAYRALIASDRVSSRTRAILTERARADAPDHRPAALSEDAFATLRAMLARIVPQTGPAPIDLAARIDTLLASGGGDGRRFADLPADVDAYRLGLHALDAAARAQHNTGFAKLGGDAQDELLANMQAGQLDAKLDQPALDAAQMRAWFEDVRGDAARLFVSHPATLERLGFSGIANGGDGPAKAGFIQVGVGEREAWEPEAGAAP